MNLVDLHIGTRLELELLNNLGEKIGNTYISQLLEIGQDKSIVISTPIFESRLIYIAINSKVSVTLFHKKYGLLGFTANVASRENRGNIAVLCIQVDGELEKIQRRKHYRLDSIIDANYRICSEDSKDESAKPTYKKAVTRNISGMGVCIVTEENVPQGTLVEVLMELSGAVQIKALCAVLRNTPIELNKGVKYELGLHFAEISQRDQDSLIKFIFEQQRVLLKKEILSKK